MRTGKDSFLFTFFAARMNTLEGTRAFQSMKEDVRGQVRPEVEIPGCQVAMNGMGSALPEGTSLSRRKSSR